MAKKLPRSSGKHSGGAGGPPGGAGEAVVLLGSPLDDCDSAVGKLIGSASAAVKQHLTVRVDEIDFRAVKLRLGLTHDDFVELQRLIRHHKLIAEET